MLKPRQECKTNNKRRECDLESKNKQKNKKKENQTINHYALCNCQNLHMFYHLLLDIMDSSFADQYANDTQLYFAFRPITTEQQSSLARIEACVSCRFLVGPKQTEAKQGKNRATCSEC